MNEHPTPDSYKQELAAQAKHEAKHSDLMQLLYDLHPMVKPTQRQTLDKSVIGCFPDGLQVVLWMHEGKPQVQFNDFSLAPVEIVFSGSYSNAQAWLKERLG